MDDLQTLRTMLDAFNEKKWNVVGSDMSNRSEPDEAKLFKELSQHIVESIGWIQYVEHLIEFRNLNFTLYYNFRSYDQVSAEQMGKFLYERNHVLRDLQRGNVPLWLNVPSDPTLKKYELCNEMCINNGLLWAQTLGTAAKHGFKVVFKTINDHDIINPSLSYYVTLLHKKVVGDKVFESKIINGDKDLTQFYTHCSRNISGSFTVMAINFAETKTKLSTKLQDKYTGTEVMQYILTVDKNGIVNINSEPVNSASIIDPVIKLKRPNRPTSFSLPPQSIGFWIFPSANFKECIFDSTENLKSNELRKIRPKTSSELLLQELIAESVDSKTDLKKMNKRQATVKKDSRKKRETNLLNPNEAINEIDSKFVKDKRQVLFSRSANMMDILDAKRDARMRNYLTLPFRMANKGLLGNNRRSKRHINVGFGKLFERLELAKLRKLNMPPIFNIGKKLESSPVISSVHDVYNKDSTDKLFKSSENHDLPRGDVFFEVGTERNHDYVDFDETVYDKPKKTSDEQHSLNNFKNEQVPIPQEGFYETFAGMPRSHVIGNAPPSTYGEMYESDVYQNAPSSHSLDRTSAMKVVKQSSNIKKIVPEIQHSWQENQENLRKAKESLQSIYIQENQEEPPNKDPRKSIKSDADNFFITKRRKRSVDQTFNDQIEQRVSKIYSNKTIAEIQTGTNRTADKMEKISLLDKMSRIIASIEKIDNLSDLSDLGMLANEIKEIEYFLLKKSQKIKWFNKPHFPIHQHSRTEDIPKKCKILAMNLEKQCLRDISTFPLKIVKREVPLTRSYGQSKIFRAKSNSRRRRSASIESPWIESREEIYTNMIPENPDSIVDIVVPATDSDVIQHIPNLHIIHVPTLNKVTTSPTRDEEIKQSASGIGSSEYSPKFMKSITSSVESLLEMLNRHVSSWWQILS